MIGAYHVEAIRLGTGSLAYVCIVAPDGTAPVPHSCTTRRASIDDIMTAPAVLLASAAETIEVPDAIAQTFAFACMRGAGSA